MLDGGLFATSGNQIKVYDYYTPATGAPYYYIDGDLAQSNGSSWPFQNKHEWTQDGTHKFFGWLAKDNNGEGIAAGNFFDDSFGFNKTDHVLTIPATTLSQNGTQFDFMYSNIESRKPATEGYDLVPLEFSHLFTAFSIAAKDVAQYNDYILESIQMKGLKTTCSATVDFSSDDPVVKIDGSANSDASFTFTPASPFKLTTDLTDIATWENADIERKHYLAWPQDPRTVSIVISYRAKENNDAEYTQYTKTLLLPYALEAGKKNNLNLEFKDKEISLDYFVEDWTTVTEEIEFSDQVTVEEHSTILWDEHSVQSVDYSTGEVILFDDEDIEATCTFTILTPKGATWTASLIPKEGHPDAFRFVEGTKYGVVGGESTIKLVVTNQDPISPRHVAELLITVQTADGRTIVVDDALTPEFDEDGEPTTYERFKIVQNLIN